MKGHWIMGLGGLAVLLLIVAGTAIGVATAARSGPSPAASDRGAAALEGTAVVEQTQQAALQAGEKPWLGIVVVQTPSGATVGAVIADSPADGVLHRGDVITAYNGTPVGNVRELREQIIASSVGDTVTISITRGGTAMDVQVTLAAHPEPLVQRPKPFPELEGIAEGELFSHIQGGQINLTDAAGNPLILSINLGTVAAKTDDSLTVTLNDGSGDQTYTVTENTAGRGLLQRLEVGARVAVVTADGSTETRIIAPARGLGQLLPLPRYDHGPRHFRMRHGPMHLFDRSLTPPSDGSPLAPSSENSPQA
ncbi:MAG: PDZ domain-containing protein [Dehalococcoidia bacterium]